jgi:hypothetical protein
MNGKVYEALVLTGFATLAEEYKVSGSIGRHTWEMVKGVLRHNSRCTKHMNIVENVEAKELLTLLEDVEEYIA